MVRVNSMNYPADSELMEYVDDTVSNYRKYLQAVFLLSVVYLVIGVLCLLEVLENPQDMQVRMTSPIALVFFLILAVHAAYAYKAEGAPRMSLLYYLRYAEHKDDISYCLEYLDKIGETNHCAAIELLRKGATVYYIEGNYLHIKSPSDSSTVIVRVDMSDVLMSEDTQLGVQLDTDSVLVYNL